MNKEGEIGYRKQLNFQQSAKEVTYPLHSCLCLWLPGRYKLPVSKQSSVSNSQNRVSPPSNSLCSYLSGAAYSLRKYSTVKIITQAVSRQKNEILYLSPHASTCNYYHYYYYYYYHYYYYYYH